MKGITKHLEVGIMCGNCRNETIMYDGVSSYYCLTCLAQLDEKGNLLKIPTPEEAKAKQKWKVKNLSELAKEELVPIEYIIEPWLPKGTLVLLGGKAGCCKSLMALLLGITIASGKQYLGEFQNFAKSGKYKILLYDLENGERVIHRRTRYLIDGMELHSDTLSNFDIIENFDKYDMEAESEIAKDYDVIILDSYRRFLEGDENDSKITDSFYQNFLKPLREIGKTIIVLHHFRKSRPEDMTDDDINDMFRGSSDISTEFDLVLGITKKKEKIDKENKITRYEINLLKGKNRLGLAIEDTICSVEKDDEFFKTNILFDRYGYLDQHADIIKGVLAMLVDEPKRCGELIKYMEREHRIGTASAYRILDKLVKREDIVKKKKLYYLSEYSDSSDSNDRSESNESNDSKK